MVELYVPRIEVALFDMAATTVDDEIEKPGLTGKLPLVISAYRDAFRKGGIEMPFDELNNCRGRDKKEVFREKVAKYRTDLTPDQQKVLALHLHDDEFVPALLENVPYVKEMPGTTETFRYLKGHDVFVATGSGFPQVVTDAINNRLGWKRDELVDYGTCGEAVGGGRPKPNMINATLRAAGKISEDADLSTVHGSFNYKCVLKVGDTVEDIKEGKGVGAVTVAVCSGTQAEDKLLAAKPTVVLPSIKSVPLYLENHGYLDRG